MTETGGEISQERRAALTKIASGVFAGLIAPAFFGGLTSRADEEQKPGLSDLPKLPAPHPGEDPLIRMMRDLQRALAKPIEERKWSMVIDVRKCVGCDACTVACVAENKLPPGVVYRPVLEEEIGTYPNVTRRFIPRPCMQCEKPPCVPVCPVHATWKRKDGIIEIDYDKCIGCRYCITACPYSARVFDSGKYYAENANSNGVAMVARNNAERYEKEAAYDWGKPIIRKNEQSPIGNARKCHFCLHRIEKGMLPQCVVSCIGRATFFGDANDKNSLVAELIGKPNVMRLKEEMGTEPKVYYLL
jgi:molybdopterin-containing oxidoreductase family iron-sulfur binding subunit